MAASKTRCWWGERTREPFGSLARAAQRVEERGLQAASLSGHPLCPATNPRLDAANPDSSLDIRYSKLRYGVKQ